MGRLRVRIKDKRICALVKAFLKSGVLTELGDREETLTGTPQGGYAQLNITRLMSSAGLCAALARRAWWGPDRRASAAHNPSLMRWLTGWRAS